MQTLKDSELRYRRLFEAAQDGILILDARTGMITDVNPYLIKMLGYLRAEFIKKKLWEVGAFKDIEASQETFEALQENETIRYADLPLKAKDGRLIQVEFISSVYLVGDKKVIQCNIRDNSAHKPAEQALLGTESQLRAVLNNAPITIFVTDSHGVFTLSEGKGLEHVGLKPGENVGVSAFDLFGSFPFLEYRGKVTAGADVIRRVLAGEEVTAITELRGVYFDNHLGPLRGTDGKVVGIVGVAVDVTEHKRAEDALRKSEVELKEAQRVGRLGGWDWDAKTDTITWSEEYYRIYGLDPKQPPPGYEQHLKAYTPESAARLDAAVKKSMETGEPYALDLEQVRPDGARRWVTARNEIKRDANGQNIGLRGTAQDITERKQAEKKILHINRLYATLSQINQTIVRAQDRDTLFSEICRVAIEQGKFRMAWIGLMEETNGLVKPVHFAGEEQGYLSNVRIEYLDEILGRGPTGTAIREERCIICQDIATDPHMIPWREQALQCGYRSSASVPFRRQGRIVGALTVYAAEPHGFDLDAENLLDEIGRDISFALDSMDTETRRKQVEEALKKSEASLEEAQRIAHLGSWEWDAETDTPTWSKELCTILEVDPTKPVPSVAEQDKIYTPESMKIMHSAIEQAMAGTPYEIELERVREDGTRKWLLARGEPRFDKNGHIAGLRGTALDITARKQAEEMIRRQLEHLTALGAIDRVIAANFDLKLSLSEILSHVTTELGIDAADILILNSNSQMLEYAAGRGFRDRAIERSRFRIGEGQAGSAALERRMIQHPDFAASGAVLAQAELFVAENVAAYFAAPLIAKGKVKGVLEIFHRSPFKPDPDWLNFFETLAGQAAIAIDNTQLFDNLQRSNVELTLAYDATIEGWSRALDLRDKETEGHSLRVTEMTVKLARAFGLSEAELVQVRWGALLHDIGKMGVPDSILQKPEPLADEEWAVMKKHPTFAYQMLAPIRYLRLALDIPYCHHEKWDGSGYPRGLKGEQIPLVARIFAVVDVWDALKSDRPYRAGWTEEKVREHIRTSSGTQFDPQVVDIFMQIPN